jgi:hypothetical protein
MKDRRQGRIRRQSVDDGRQRALEMGFRGGFRLFDWGAHRSRDSDCSANKLSGGVRGSNAIAFRVGRNVGAL